jgi:hypothetical protein
VRTECVRYARSINDDFSALLMVSSSIESREIKKVPLDSVNAAGLIDGINREGAILRNYLIARA